MQRSASFHQPDKFLTDACFSIMTKIKMLDNKIVFYFLKQVFIFVTLYNYFEFK